jgi:beta-N-acetylhexosaminidase
MTERALGDEVLGQLLLAFEGLELPVWLAQRLRSAPPAGVTLFRFRNVADPAQIRRLTDAIQALAPPGKPFLICADQEGGQFQALGDGPTPFAGAMALGAAGDEGLTERVGAAVGTELAAVGVNVCYAPVADVASNSANPALGIRSYGADPAAVARHVAATVRGLRSAGVAATAKHFPGKGDVAVDTHHALGVSEGDRERIEAVELPPFRAAIAAGVDLVMSGHFAVPALTGDERLPATLSRVVMADLLRGRLGFGGVTVSDALDMRALAQGERQIDDVIAALGAGVDLLLLGPDEGARERITAGLPAALADGRLDPDRTRAALARITALRTHLVDMPRPPLSVVGGPAHRALSRELADRSVTLVRDRDGLLPLRPDPGAAILVVMPRPTDLTPADTSSTVAPGLASAIRDVLPAAVVEDLVMDRDPTEATIHAVRERAAAADAIIIGTIAAAPGSGQAALVDAVLATDRPTITVALRTPWDLLAYPDAGTHLCTYSIQPDSLAAFARVLVGAAEPSGRLPTPLGDLYPLGHAG